MKKLLLSIALVAFTFAATAQDGKFNLGVNAALPTGDFGEISSFGIGVEANYLFDVSEGFQIGPSVSYINFFGETVGAVEFPSTGFMPLAAAGRFNASDEFTLGADLGYAIGVSNAEGGEFYWRPMVGYDISDKVMLQASYSGMGDLSFFGLGAMFAL
ncbi:outer membrane beta-barrel protein [Tenacibaculum aquimarinum]|uniref:outer membrane beta-barrel protein n=1 Tax=Tenacibaculum aquimarinum TaxID=2910675 RepID=UPI001F0A2A38|nr:outer membrane beta-barrel protein [Tenacibaculum aquimarinum]MCH3882314.1 outer membrane beta-barrel protein [Tenacibaculum aquimarinum]MCH3885323.1 outer membrane beta-barrel protein [Tenacibaculum aquimarinum]